MGNQRVGSYQSRLHAFKEEFKRVKGSVGAKDEARAASALRELEEYGRKLQSRTDKAARERREEENMEYSSSVDLEPCQLGDTELMDQLGMFDIARTRR